MTEPVLIPPQSVEAAIQRCGDVHEVAGSVAAYVGHRADGTLGLKEMVLKRIKAPWLPAPYERFQQPRVVPSPERVRPLQDCVARALGTIPPLDLMLLAGRARKVTSAPSGAAAPPPRWAGTERKAKQASPGWTPGAPSVVPTYEIQVAFNRPAYRARKLAEASRALEDGAVEHAGAVLDELEWLLGAAMPDILVVRGVIACRMHDRLGLERALGGLKGDGRLDVRRRCSGDWALTQMATE